MFYKEEIALIAALNQTGVRYLVVGGHAVISHGYLRSAKSLDLWLMPDARSVERIANAFCLVKPSTRVDVGVLLAPSESHIALPDWNVILWNRQSGLNFDEAYSRAMILYAQGVQYMVLGLSDLLHNKAKVGRARDLEDIDQLKALQKHPKR